MPKAADLNAAVQSIIASEVQAVLQPYLPALDHLAKFLGGAPVRSTPANAATIVRHAKRRARRAGKVTASSTGAFEVGQTVIYKQGRGKFLATVRAVDIKAGTLQLVRVSDGKKIARPSSKVRATKAGAQERVAKRAPKTAKMPAKTPKKRQAARKAANPNAGFMRPRQPDEALAEIVGDKPISRGEVTKRLWAYIKKNELQDTANARMINADEKLAKVFDGKKKVVMFEMLRLASKHLG